MVVFRSDPCGIICIIITYLAMFYADYVVVRHLVMPTMANTLWCAFNVVVFNTILLLGTISHLRAVLSDPGIVPLPTTSIDFSDLHAGQKRPMMNNGMTVCMKCETYRPPRAHHCRICRRCIRRMDHHCPWINNCVGELNQKFFIQFLFYIGILSVYATALVITAWILDPQKKGELKHARLIHSIVLIFECILFGIFVVAIGCDQISSIWNDETAVEHVKKDGPKRSKRSKMVLLQEVFGYGSMLLWCLPFQVDPGVQDMNSYGDMMHV